MRNECLDLCQGNASVEEKFGKCMSNKRSHRHGAVGFAPLLHDLSALGLPVLKNHGLSCWQNEQLFSPAAVTESRVQTVVFV